MTTLFTEFNPGDQLPASAWNGNFDLVQESIADTGPWIVSGLVPSAGAGLSVSITSGVASIGGRITVAGTWSIAGLANNTLNHLYLKDDGTGTSNTSGTQPADSVKLGTATTAAGSVTSVNTANSSGRQAFVRPENQVPGDVGSMGSLNLADWNATAGDGFTFYGSLPAGAMNLNDAVILDPASSARNVIQATGDFTELTLKKQTGQTADPFVVQDSTGAPLFQVTIAQSLDIAIGARLGAGNQIAAAFADAVSPSAISLFDDNATFMFGGHTNTGLSGYFSGDLILAAYRSDGTPGMKLATAFDLFFDGTYDGAGGFTDCEVGLVNDTSGFGQYVWNVTQDRGKIVFGTGSFNSTDGQVHVVPLTDATRGITLRRHSATQTAALLETQTHTGASLFALGPAGEINLSGSAGTSGYVLTSQGAGSAVVWAAAGGSGTLAGLSDVSLSGTAQGDLLYRGASAWNNLANGTSGQVLVTNGASANPSWTGSLVLSSLSVPGAGGGSEKFGASSAAAGLFATALGNSSSTGGVVATAVGYSAGAAGTYSVAVGAQATAGHDYVIAIGKGVASTAISQLLIGSDQAPVTDGYFNDVTSTTPDSIKLNAAGGSGSNIAGADLTLAGGRGTGSAKGGDLIFQTAPAGGSGTSLNSLVTIYKLTGDSKIAWFNVTPVVQQANASQAAITAIADSNAKSALQAVYDLLKNYGLAPATA